MPIDPKILKLQRVGPLVKATFGHADPDIETLEALGIEAPVPVDLIGFLDTGAANTLIKYGTATGLGIIPCDRKQIRGIEMTYITAIGYYGHLTFAGSVIVPCVAFEALPRNHPCDALIGRDVLQHAIWTYNGPSGEFELSIRRTRVPMYEIPE